MKRFTVALLLSTGLAWAQAPVAESERVEIAGPDALRVLLFHYRAVLIQQELQRLNAQIQAALKAACEGKQVSPCKVVAIGEETLTVEREKPAGGTKP